MNCDGCSSVGTLIDCSEQIGGGGDDALGRFLTGDPTGLHDSSSDSCVRSMTTLIFLFPVLDLTVRGLIPSSVS